MINYRIGLHYGKPMFFSKLMKKTEDMAQEGWVLWKMYDFFVIYRKQEPCALRCNLKTFETSLFNAKEERKERDEFRRHCEENGWQYINTIRNTQIYIIKDQIAPDIANDEKLEWREVKHSLSLVLFCISIIALYLVVLTHANGNAFDIMHLLTDNLLFIVLAGLTILLLKLVGEGLIVLYWYVRNRAWLHSSDELKKKHTFSNVFAIWFAIFRMLGKVLFFVSLVFGVLMMPLSSLLRTLSFAWIIRFNGRTSTLGQTAVIVVILLVAGLFVSPIVEEWERRLPDENEVVRFSDLALEHKPFSFTSEPTKSLFTTKQIKYKEQAKNHFVSTEVYTFKNKQLLTWYIQDLIHLYEVQPFSNDKIKGGYLDADMKSLYFVKDMTCYRVSASVGLEENREFIIHKLSH